MRRLYPDAAYRPEPDPGNFWQSTAEAPVPPPLEGDARAEVAVIGGGYTGLHAALRLAEAHGREVAVLDAAWPGWGASGRNGGFACIGGAKLSGPTLIRRFGEAGARAFFAAQVAAVDHVAETLERLGIDADRAGSGEYHVAHRPSDAAGFPAHADFVTRWYRPGAAVLGVAALRERGLASPAFHGGLHVPVGFGLNPLKYVLGLAAAAAARGVRLHGRSPVVRVEREGPGFRLHGERGTLRARQVLVATNGYSSDGLPDWLTGRYLPVISNVLATRPLTADERAAQGMTAVETVADTRSLLHYFRLLPDGRFLFGMRGGTGLGAAEAARTAARIRADFRAMFPAWAGVETPWSWNGLACLTGSLVAYLGPVPELPGGFAAFGYHGGGVAMASWCGARAADLMAGTIGVADLPPLTLPPRRFPLPPLRRHYLKAAYAWYGWRDA